MAGFVSGKPHGPHRVVGPRGPLGGRHDVERTPGFPEAGGAGRQRTEPVEPQLAKEGADSDR